MSLLGSSRFNWWLSLIASRSICMISVPSPSFARMESKHCPQALLTAFGGQSTGKDAICHDRSASLIDLSGTISDQNYIWHLSWACYMALGLVWLGSHAGCSRLILYFDVDSASVPCSQRFSMVLGTKCFHAEQLELTVMTSHTSDQWNSGMQVLCKSHYRCLHQIWITWKCDFFSLSCSPFLLHMTLCAQVYSKSIFCIHTSLLDYLISRWILSLSAHRMHPSGLIKRKR